uniref:uncharacterized protein LOC122597181 n=1 Tax=Erigeron canadensis TaxID=72917 RepID=UPI001CB954FA|nr:uncharacterized protein LOC122597181 [Erigeron canadensis]
MANGEETGSSSNIYDAPKCDWYIRALKTKTHQKWEVTRWVNTHNCIGAYASNYNTNLTSTIIASHILHSIENDPSYPSKNIQVDIKNHLNVNVSYKKAWYGKKKAMEILYGDWESNFDELPTYIASLQNSNPGTIIKWFHHPNSSSNIMTFKYIFWAFGPSIEAFRHCRSVVCVNGTHLRGDYKGKMLVAVTKDANNQILPIAYAIVDEETSHSWCWFLRQLRYYVAHDRRLCVVSDRHRGIIHAMKNLKEWNEPLGYHRFCLRHIRSNFNARFKNMALKQLCWAMGSTCQKRKFAKYENDMKQLDPMAWNYLNQVNKSQWCQAFDECCRWIV